MTKPKAFITQVPHRRDSETGALVPAVNIGPASEHGELVIMLPSQASFFATNDLIKILHGHLKDYNYERGDTIICIGDPVIIGAACGILGKIFDHFSMLRWDREIRRYLKVHVNLRGV